jgi:hypothetical protein
MRQGHLVQESFVVLALALAVGACSTPGKPAVGAPAEFQFELAATSFPSSFKAATASKIKVRLRNASEVVWPAIGRVDSNPLSLSYHWYDKNNAPVLWEGLRTALSKDLSPNEEVIVDADVMAPAQPGEYLLQFDVVRERVAWFTDKGAVGPKYPVRVQ